MDKDYWEKYYQNHGKDSGISNHSSFADFCYSDFFRNNHNIKNIVELGSGNGRDAIYLANKGYKVVAIDQSPSGNSVEIDNMESSVSGEFISISEDFINYDYSLINDIDVFYSRFTMHAISKNDESELLPKILKYLKVGGLFCIEVRTTKDPIFGVGKDCGDNAFITDHYRRFIDSQEFLRLMLPKYELIFFKESNNLSIYKDDNPVLMRIILKKLRNE
jgi:tellurite methyltransferase